MTHIETTLYTPDRAMPGRVESSGPLSCDWCHCSLTDDLDYETGSDRIDGADYRTKTWSHRMIGTDVICDSCAEGEA